MSQIFNPNGGGGGGSGVITITGNTGGALSGSNINIVTANSTAKFAGSGTTETLDFGITNLLVGSLGASLSGAFRNASLGHLALRDLVSGDDNAAFGDSALENATTGNRSTAVGSAAMQGANGSDEVGIGYQALRFSTGGKSVAVGGLALSDSLLTGAGNVGIGYLSLAGLTTGANNIALGLQSGQGCTGASSSNILIGSDGAIESNTIRIGEQGSGLGQQNRNFQAGITGVTAVGSPVAVSSTGQLSDLGFGTATQVLTSNGAGVSPTWQAAGGGGSSTYFSAYLSAPTGNVTGDGTLYGPVVFDATLTNVGAAYNTGTGVFTAPATGLYSFQHTICFYGGDALTTQYLTVWDGSAFGGRSFQLTPTAQAPANTTIFSASITIPMTSGDTMAVTVLTAGTNLNVEIYGAATTYPNTVSLFSGFRVA